MTLSTYSAISPIDGRYHEASKPLGDFFSEGALIRHRVMVEVEYFIALCDLGIPQLSSLGSRYHESLKKIYTNFSPHDVKMVKEIEKTTNHDVKAVEYFLKQKFELLGLGDQKEFIHFGLTSQDINNTALPYSLKSAWKKVLAPMLADILKHLENAAFAWRDIPMLARTHGQPASPTLLGKEIYVFAERLKAQLDLLAQIPFSAKFGGATGNFNAHHAAYPDIDWITFADQFVANTLGLKRSRTTTQIEHYDNLAAYLDNIKRINTILLDFNRDMWAYVSMNYFRQRIKQGEVGSSAMPHKVNPIDFENSEGNLGIANAICEHLSAKLPISRLQRDLSDSTVTRNIGVPLAHALIGYRSLLKGLAKLIVNTETISNDLDSNWAVVSEGIQTILRREGHPEPYEALKALTRTHTAITRNSIHKFIDDLDVSAEVKTELKAITPENYTGICPID